jgi:hypothetical protein
MNTVQNGKGSKPRISNQKKFWDNYDNIDFGTKFPCVGVCKLKGDVCIGCGRTSGEISYWPYFTDSVKKKINKRLKSGK